MDYEIRLLQFNDGDKSLQKVVDLQNLVYKGKHSFTIKGFKKWYLENPMGRVISFNAFYGEELVAHYACIPYKMEIEGREVLGLFDMATVTHPDHRGKGLFTKLARITYDYAKEQGFEFVIGIANANSFPGYMKHFPFTFVGQLDVKIGYGRDIVPVENKTFYACWDKESLAWRTKINTYQKGDDCIIGQRGCFVRTFMGHFDNNLLTNVSLPQIKEGSGIKPMLYVGLGAKIKGLYFTIPKYIKHSPFNLIFLDLTNGKLPIMTRDNVFFQLFDFDVA